MTKRTFPLVFLLLSMPVFGGVSPEARLKAFLNKASSLEASFVQVQVDEKGNLGKRSNGMFYLQRPGKFRWNYEKPYHQEIVSSAGKVWFFDKDLDQVTAKKLNQAIGSTPALLLTGDVPLEKNFTIESQSDEEGIAIIKLIPKSEESGFKYVQIGIENDLLVGMELSDNFGQLTRIYFENLKTGIKIDPALFAFKPPQGVDVFEEK
ncbi:MAG: outer membrane lipoprotein carrier protein LolA [Gammaproteobacteria bacterium]|nr:outer membrane lipoprotein carrier protein LolA [Gammaproteobacteria bacterium]NBT44244.1 outer membrane lipoprotein carrier protein LolA [Gammaproteobacteria bacterium]NBY22035.1 outer membrane lipoprotein carrier protein LolA [Gammaproteobacteria bacterium]NDE33291.1 outer membrane lipoprotein carrier protein LolA [Gammaproteobacteria bacterium]NDE55451.1 outer membrane lipoprotein carrier protein LolA [Gammaproteobacteria bacterium]